MRNKYKYTRPEPNVQGGEIPHREHSGELAFISHYQLRRRTTRELKVGGDPLRFREHGAWFNDAKQRDVLLCHLTGYGADLDAVRAFAARNEWQVAIYPDQSWINPAAIIVTYVVPAERPPLKVKLKKRRAAKPDQITINRRRVNKKKEA